MKKERIILSFFALLIGLAVAGGAFYLYQNTQKGEPEVMSDTVVNIPTPTLQPNQNLLTIEKPQNEDVVSSQSITISGKTLPDTSIVAQTGTDEQIAEASSNGSFQLTIDIDEGVNIIQITAIYADGSQKSEQLTITHSEEDF